MSDADKNLAYGITADPTPFEKGMQQAVASAKGASGQMEGHFKKIQDAMGGVQKQLLVIAGIVAGGTAFKAAIEDSNKLTGETLKLSKMLGITGDAASTLNIALGDIGSDADTYVDVFSKFARQIKKNEEGLQAMGLVTRDANGELRDSNTLFTEALQGVGSYKAGLDQNTAAQTYFGKSIDDVMKLQKLNNSVLDEARKKNEDLSLTITQDNVAASKAYKLAMNDVGDVFTAINKVIGDTVMPIFTDLANYFASTGPYVLQIFKGAMLGLVSVFYAVRAAVQMVAGVVFESFSLIIDAAGLLGETLVKFIKGDYAGAWDAGKRLGERYVQGVKSVLSNMDDATKESDAAIAKTFNSLYGERKGFGQPKGGSNTMGDFKDTNGTENVENSRASEWDAQLAELKLQFQERMNLEGSFAQFGKAAEVKFWSDKLAITAAGTQENIAVRRKLAELQLGIGQEAYAKEIAVLQTQEAEFKNNLQAKLGLLDQQLALVKQRYGSESKEYEGVQKQIVEAKRAASDQLKQIDLQTAAAGRDAALAQLQGRQQISQLEADMGLLTQAQVLAQTRAFEIEKNAIALAALKERQQIALADPDRNIVELSRINLEMEQLERQHQLRLGEIRNLSTKESQRTQLDGINSIQQGWQSVLQQAMQGQLSLGGVMKGLWASITQAVTGAIAKMGVEWLAMQVKNMIFGKVVAASTVAEEAGKAGAGGVASMAAAPFPLNLGAPAFGAAMMAASMAFAPMASAAGGYDIPSMTNPITQLHAREMVLPATYADVIRGMAAGDDAGQGGGAPIHIHASGGDWINKKDLGALLTKMQRNFEFVR
jgi:hypothetical protein